MKKISDCHFKMCMHVSFCIPSKHDQTSIVSNFKFSTIIFVPFYNRVLLLITVLSISWFCENIDEGLHCLQVNLASLYKCIQAGYWPSPPPPTALSHPGTPDAMAAAAEPFASIPVDILQEILLQLPSSVSLVRAALVSKQWGGIISNTDFLDRYRKLHPSSPLLGIFSSERPFGLPGFSLMDSVRSDTDLKAVERGADFLLAELEQDPSWRIRDSRNGHLLLCRPGESDGDSFSIYNPISRRLVTIPVDRPHDRVAYFADCLLVDAAASFRVVSVQQHQGRIRAVDYDPHKLQWRFSNWESPWALDRPSKLKSWALEPMHAAGLIFWAYGASLALVLDCSSMKFSVCSIPVSIRSSYAIGEIEDGVGCLVCLDDVTNDTTNGSFKVWLLNTSGGTITWEMSGDKITVTELLGEEARVRQVVSVTNGLALLSYDDRYDQFVIDLKNRSLHDEIGFRGQAYPYQMPWPPRALLSLRDICQGTNISFLVIRVAYNFYY
jgi:hypothetical protein